MITQEKALSIILEESVPISSTEKVSISKALNRILAMDIVSDIDMPPFDKSAMDGYACKILDIKYPMEILETIAAGVNPSKTITNGTCSKIMTGAPIPNGADTVIMIEYTNLDGNNQVVFTKDKTSSNICLKGEDFRKGDILLSKGILIKPANIPVFATAGLLDIEVVKQLKVGVISTGNELVEPNEKLSVGKIRNSNAYQIIAQSQEIGAITEYYGIAEDTLESTIEKIEAASKSCNIILLSGGVSAGDFDFVPDAIIKCGFDIKFKSIAVQPGRPTLFAKKGNIYIFGLPGNPVSSFIQLELLVKPLYYRLLSHNFQAKEIQIPYGTSYHRKKTERKAWLPIFINSQGIAMPVEYNGSAHINAYINANAIMSVEIDIGEINKGDLVHARLI